MNQRNLLSALCLVSISGCGTGSDSQSASPAMQEPAIRTVTLRSHLIAEVNIDPILRPGEVIRIQPDTKEPFTRHESLQVKLPRHTPYIGDDAQQFLRGYAVGRAAKQNGQFL